MKKLEEINDWQEAINEVVCVDCLELMKKMPDKCIDLVIIDPPYIQDSHGGGGAFGTKMREYHKGVDSLGYGFENQVLDEIKRVLRYVNMYVFCSKNQVLQILTWAKENNLLIDILCYHKTNPTPTCNNKYLSDTEYIIFIREKGVKLYGDYHSKKKYFIQENGKSEFNHPTVKPIEIIKTLVNNSSLKGDLVFDCFLGSGTTARACKDLGRNFIGCDIEEKYCQIADDRLKQQNLF